MIKPEPSTIAKNLVMGQQSNRLKKEQKRGNSEVTTFRYKVIVLFHIKLKMFL